MTDLPDAVVEAAAEAIYNHQRNDLHNDPEWADVEERFKEMYREEASIALSAASVRNSELEADLLDMTKTASEYNDLAHSANADWSKELERATALQAELDNLRASLTKRTHDWLAHCKRLDAEREAITDDLAKAWKELGEIESGASEDE